MFQLWRWTSSAHGYILAADLPFRLCLAMSETIGRPPISMFHASSKTSTSHALPKRVLRRSLPHLPTRAKVVRCRGHLGPRARTRHLGPMCSDGRSPRQCGYQPRKDLHRRTNTSTCDSSLPSGVRIRYRWSTTRRLFILSRHISTQGRHRPQRRRSRRLDGMLKAGTPRTTRMSMVLRCR